MHDLGSVFIEGYGYYKAYFAEALEKLQVDINVFRVGEFKSFVEPFLRNDMSEEDKAASRGWLEAMWGIYSRDVIEVRGIAPEVFDQYVNNLPAVLEAADGDAGKVAIEADCHDMPDMQIAVRFRWKPGRNFGVLAGLEVVVNDLADKIPRFAIVHGAGLYANFFKRGAIRVQLRAVSIRAQEI